MKVNSINYPLYYREVASELSGGNLTTLKTDCYNECIDNPVLPYIKGDVKCLELIKERAEYAKRKFPNISIRQGDLTKCPYKDNSIDLILDFSTIDHIPDFKKCLDEYQRILAPHGVFVIVVWLSCFGYGGGLNLKRNCFNIREFEEELNKRFYVPVKKRLMRRRIRKYIALYEYRGFHSGNEGIK